MKKFYRYCLIVICLILCGCANKKINGDSFSLTLEDSKSYTWESVVEDKDVVNVEKINSDYKVVALKEGKTRVIFKSLYFEDKRMGEYKVYDITVDKNLKISKNSFASSSSLTLGEEAWIAQGNRFFLNDMDYFQITKPVKWEIPADCDGNKTCSFSISVPYNIYVNGKKYKGTYEIGDNNKQNDKNPKYKIQVIDLTKEGFMKIKISNK